MAKKKSTKDTNKDQKHSLGREQTKKLWAAKPARQWLNLLKDINPNGRWTLQGEHTIKGCCPYHGEKTPSFTLSFKMGLGKCFGCGKVVDDLISLVSKAKAPCSYTEALLLTQQYLGLGDEFSKYSEEIAYYYKVQEFKKQAAMAFRDIIMRVIKEDPKELEYLKPAITYLIKGRGLTNTSFIGSSNAPVGVFGKPEHVKAMMLEEWREMYDEYFPQKFQKPEFWGSVIFHYNDSPGRISRFKLRLPDKLAVEKVKAADPQFLNVTEDQARLFIRKDNSIFIEDPFTSRVGVLGLYNYQHLLGSQSDPNVYITEGEFDVLSVMNAQMQTGSFDFILLGTSGTGSLDVGFLRDYGVRTVWLIPDHPAKNGDGYARNFLAEKDNFVQPGSPIPFAIKIFQWPAVVLGFDLDEAVRNHEYEGMRDFLVTNRNATFMNSNLWIRNKCDTDIAKIKMQRDHHISAIDPNSDKESYQTEMQNIRDDARQQIHAKILEWFTFVHDPTERLAYAQKYIAQEDIDITQDSRVHNDVYSLDTKEGCVQKITDAFSEFFEFCFYQQRNTAYDLCVWSKLKKEVVSFPDSDSKKKETISTFLEQDVVAWIGKLLKGSPMWEMDECKHPMNMVTKQEANALTLFNAMVRSISGRTVNKSILRPVGQGIHHFGLPDNVMVKGSIYFVNGNKVFKGTPNRETDMIEWEYIDNCVDDGLLFALDVKEKWSFVSDVSDLYASNKVKLKDTFKKVKEILNGWTFDNHDIIVEYLAAQVLALPISAAVGNVNITYITGESESGKTSLVHHLLGGTRNQGHDIPTIMESARSCVDLTPAGMYQEFDQSTITMLYDEAEVSEHHNTKHDQQTKEIQRLIMGVPQGGASFMRGGQTASQRVNYFVRMPIIMAGINLPTDRTMLSRIVIIYTKKEYGHISLSDHISKKFSNQDMEALRRDITLALLPLIPKLVLERRLMKKVLNSLDESIKLSDRYLDNIITPLLIYKMADGDYKKLFRELYAANKDRLDCIHGTESSSDLVNSCLYSEEIKITHQDGSTVNMSARNLILAGEFTILNNTGCGIYYYAEKDWIIIFWRQAKHSVLRHDMAYSRQSEDALRERVAKTTYVIPNISNEEHESIKRILHLPELRTSAYYTVVRAAYLGENPVEEADYKVADEVTALQEFDPELPPVGVYEDPEIPVEDEQPITMALDFRLF